MGKFIEAERKIVVNGGRRRGNGELLFNEYRVSVWADESVLAMDNEDG